MCMGHISGEAEEQRVVVIVFVRLEACGARADFDSRATSCSAVEKLRKERALLRPAHHKVETQP